MSSVTSRNRRRVLKGAAALGAYALSASPARSAAKPFEGVELNVSCWSAPFPKLLQTYLPEFEKLTGIKVNYDTPGFLIYNQRVDLELSTRGSSYDVLNITFIYVDRWLRAGWFAPLNDFLKDPAATPKDFDIDDFLPATRKIMSDKQGNLYGIPWTCDISMAAAGRYDLVTQAGLAMPTTFDEIEKVAAATNKNGVAGFLGDNRHGWNFPPYLQGFGGNVFRKPPDDLMPMLDTREAIAAADFYCHLLRDYGPNGVLSYSYDQVTAALKQGRGNYVTEGHIFLMPAADPDSKEAKTVRYSPFPRGPAGQFPGFATHAWGIPVGAKNKRASWEFIKWAMSKEMMMRAVTEKGYSSPSRRSVVQSPEFKKRLTLNDNDVADIYLKGIETAGGSDYMAYRIVHVFPQVDTLIGQAMERIVSKQMSAADSMRQAQASAIADLKKAGVKL
ncbi:MAG TPA: extracellular solute-binding protein [Casimicrobiaceae bacterium]|jgi:multiple sugar transport system substrate-binding protein|nr:extracellular solute-binding protein [Casimicrobiaceae bacterium]